MTGHEKTASITEEATQSIRKVRFSPPDTTTQAPHHRRFSETTLQNTLHTSEGSSIGAPPTSPRSFSGTSGAECAGKSATLPVTRRDRGNTLTDSSQTAVDMLGYDPALNPQDQSVVRERQPCLGAAPPQVTSLDFPAPPEANAHPLDLAPIQSSPSADKSRESGLLPISIPPINKEHQQDDRSKTDGEARGERL